MHLPDSASIGDTTADPAPPLRPFVIGIVGDSGSGKHTVADAVCRLLGPERVTDLRLDDYHRYTREERHRRGLTPLNPRVHDLSLMLEHLDLLRAGRQIRNRSYEHSDGSFGPIRVIGAREIVIARGLLGFPSEALRRAYDLAVFLAPESELLFRWKLRRDVRERGYSEAEVLKRIARHLLDAKEFVLPQAERADVVVRSRVAEWDAPDLQVETSLELRGATAEMVRDGMLERFGAAVHLSEGDSVLEARLAPDLELEAVERWALELFPNTPAPELLGSFLSDDGGRERRAHLALAEVFIAAVAERLRAEERSAPPAR